MNNNQYTTKAPLAGKNLNVRLNTELRTRLDAASLKHGMPNADIVRHALEQFLPMLEALPAAKGNHNAQP
jgi:predicted DNA-binding protein